LPADAHDTGPKKTSGFDLAFAARGARAAAQLPEAWVSSTPRVLPALSLYSPTAVQLPADAHDTEPKKTTGLAAAFAGRGARTPVAQVPEAWVSSSPCRWSALSV
jgi:hypothetical protein